MYDIIPRPRVSITPDFMTDLVEVLERHGHAPASGASTVGALGYNGPELSAFVAAVVETPAAEDGA